MLISQIPYVSPTQLGGGGVGGVIDRCISPCFFGNGGPVLCCV